jgi:two-component system sensor histidine kinase KdpD
MKSSLLRSIGHDLRTPLTGIQCGSSYLADHAETLARGDIRRMAEDISNQSTWLITMVENILYMTRLDNDRLEADKQPEVVDDVVNEAVSHVPALRERDFSVSLPAQVSTVPMDGRMIVQVLVNLLDNAVKYTPQGCRIRLSAEAREGRMYFCVDDAGSGIAPELRKKIFDSFVTSGKIGPDGRKGIGLGLAICRAAVRAHGGEISAEGAPLGGARFIFWLPAAEPDDTSKEDDPDGT